MATDPMVFQFVGEAVKNATDAFVVRGTANVISAIQMIALTGVTLYITLTGYGIMTGSIQAPFWTFLKLCIKLVIIAAFALSVDGYTGKVMTAFDGLETGLSAALTTGNSSAESIYKVLDHSLGQGIDMVLYSFDMAGDAGMSKIGLCLGWIVAGIIVTLGTAIVTLLGGAVIITSKFALAVMFAIGPLFIMCLMFPITARFFDSWFSQVMNYIITIVIMAAVMSFAMKSFSSFISTSDLLKATEKVAGKVAEKIPEKDQHPLFSAIQIGTVTAILAWIILQVSGMASGLAGGVSMAAMGIRHLATPVTGGLSAMKGAKNLVNPTSTRHDLKSGKDVTGSRLQHLRAGNTMLNPAYRQHAMQNLFSKGNWGGKKGGDVKS